MNDHDHLDDDILGALLDGADTAPAARGHLDGCQRCAARLDALVRGRAALGDVEPVDARTRRALIDTAVQAGPAPRSAPGATLLGARRAWWQSRAFAAAAVAATLVVVVGAVALFDDDGGDVTALAPEGVVEGGGGSVGIEPDLLVGDLGDLGDSATIRSALGELERVEAAPGAQNRAGGDAAPDGGVALDEADDGPPDDDEAVASAPPAQEPATAEEKADIARCLSLSGIGQTEETELILGGTGTFQGTSAVVFAFRTPPRSEQVLALILAADDCSILQAQSFE